MVMLRQLQNGLNQFIERFQDRWETQPSFRATWSIIAGAFAIIFIASSLLVSLNIANSLTSGSTTNTNPGANVLYAGGNSGQQTPRPVAQASPNVTPTPAANPIATSNAPTPTATASPTPGAGTPSATGTPGDGTPVSGGTPTATLPPNETVTATQQPTAGWAPTGQNQITNVVTTPQVPNGQIDFKLDFGCKQIDVQGQLDGNGAAQAIQQSVNIPSCFKSPTQALIKVTVTISSQTVTFSTPFYAKGQ